MSATGPGNRAVPMQGGTMPTAGSEVVHIKAKSLLRQGRRQALSNVNSNACLGSVRREQQSIADCRPSPKKAITTDGAKVQSAEMHCPTKQSGLTELLPAVIGPKNIAQGPDKTAADLSMEAMPLNLDCLDDDLCMFPDLESLAVADDTPEDNALLSLITSSMDDKADANAGLCLPRLPAWPELELSGRQCSTPNWRELVPEVAVPDLEEEESIPADFSDIEAMHLYNDDEHLFELPEEFQLHDNLLDVLRDVRGVGWHQKPGMPCRMSSTPPEFAPHLPLEVECLHEKLLDFDALDVPIQEDELQCVPFD